MLTSKNKALLKGLANHLKPQIILGKGDIDEKVISSINDSLEAHELIKVKILQNSSSTCQEAAETIVQATESELVGIIGKTIILYKESKKKRRIIL